MTCTGVADVPGRDRATCSASASGGEVFYEAASILSAFVLLGHWFEMRARGGANEAIRTLLSLAPPKAVVLRDGQEVEIPTSEVAAGDLLLVRPGAKVAVDGAVEEGERATSAVAALGELGAEVVRLTGDNEATAAHRRDALRRQRHRRGPARRQVSKGGRAAGQGPQGGHGGRRGQRRPRPGARPTSASPSGPVPTWPSRPPMSC